MEFGASDNHKKVEKIQVLVLGNSANDGEHTPFNVPNVGLSLAIRKFEEDFL